jgi:hypothetical protein
MTELKSGPTNEGDLLVVFVTNPDARHANDANRGNFMTDVVIQQDDLTSVYRVIVFSSSLADAIDGRRRHVKKEKKRFWKETI